MQAYRPAKVQCKTAAREAGGGLAFDDVDEPFHGLKVVATGDHLQRIQARAGVGCVRQTGDPMGYHQKAEDTHALWSAPPFRHPAAKILFLAVHGNHRLQGLLRELHATGCVDSPSLNHYS